MDSASVQVRSPTNSDDLLHSLLSLSFIQMGRCAMHKCKAVVKKKKKKIECSFGQHSNKFLKYFWCEPLLSVYLSTWERWQGIPSWQLRILLAYFLHLQYPCDDKHWYTVHILVRTTELGTLNNCCNICIYPCTQASNMTFELSKSHEYKTCLGPTITTITTNHHDYQPPWPSPCTRTIISMHNTTTTTKPTTTTKRMITTTMTMHDQPLFLPPPPALQL